MDLDPDADEQVVTTELPENVSFISVYKLLNGRITEFRSYGDIELEKIDKYQQRLREYDFSTIVIENYPIDIACEVFTRINTGGTELTLFEIMVAKTYDEKRNFDLGREYEWLLDNKGATKDLEDADYDTIPASTVLQCIAAHLKQAVRRQDILKLDKYEVIDSWPVVKSGIFLAVDYFRSHLRIPVSLLLPYNALLVPFTYFFIRKGNKASTAKQNKLLVQYFWWASLSNRFSSGVEGKLALDIKRMDEILQEIPPSTVRHKSFGSLGG